MGLLRKGIKKIVLSNKFLSGLYGRWRGFKAYRMNAKMYGNMSRRSIFESIYDNFTWGVGWGKKSSILGKVPTLIFM